LPRRQPLYVEGASGLIGSPSAETSRRTGDSSDSLAAHGEGCEGMSGATSGHILGQSSMGNGESNIEAGIIALNCTSVAFVLNSGHAYSALHSAQRFKTTARSLKQQTAIACAVSDIPPLLYVAGLNECLCLQGFVVGIV
jgi:hypothetical protein